MQNSHNELSQDQYPEVTGVLLAGGKSRRMGRDKAGLIIDGESLFARTRRLLQQFFPRVIIAGERPDLAQSDIPAYADIYPGSALGGLHTGLVRAQTDWIFVAPCDMPYPDEKIVLALLAHREGASAVVPRTEAGYEPVFALYHKDCLPFMEQMLRNNEYRIYDFYQQINIRYLYPEELPEGWQKSLININTPDDLANIKEKD